MEWINSDMSTSAGRMKSGGLWEMSGFARVVAFIGAGGKTTCLSTLATELDTAGKKVVVTTTTKVFPSHLKNVWQSPKACPPPEMGSPCFWYAEIESLTGKWIGPSTESVDAALKSDHDRYWVIEGDGARGRKLKLWAAHEPQIPLKTECAVLLVSGELWGKTINAEDIHRAVLNSQFVERQWNNKTAWEYFFESPVFYSVYSHMSWVILINQFKDEAKHFKDEAKHPILLEELATSGKRFLKSKNPQFLPAHLKVALGDARKGTIRWYDLW